MAVKVLVERTVKTGFESFVLEMLRHMRAEAVRTRGYLYGETWRSVEDPKTFMVLSVWGSFAHWQKWSQGDFRLKTEERLAPMQEWSSTIRVFEDATEP